MQGGCKGNVGILQLQLYSMIVRNFCSLPTVSVPLFLCSLSPGLRSHCLHSQCIPRQYSRLTQTSRLSHQQLRTQRRIASPTFATSAAMPDHSLLTVHRIPCLSVRRDEHACRLRPSRPATPALHHQVHVLYHSAMVVKDDDFCGRTIMSGSFKSHPARWRSSIPRKPSPWQSACVSWVSHPATSSTRTTTGTTQVLPARALFPGKA